MTVTGSNGCSSTDLRAVPIRPAPTAALSGPASACSGQPTNLSVSLTGQPPWSLKWSDGLVQAIQTSPATRVVTLAADTAFSLTSVTDGNGCTGTVSGSVSITVRQAPTALVSGEGTVCSGDAVTISAVVTSALPFTAQWNDGVVQTGTGSTTLTRVVNPSSTTVYKIDAISDGACSVPGSGVALVVVGLDPRAALVTAPFDVCAGTSGAIASVPDAGAGASYAWTILNGTIDGGQGTPSITFTPGDSGQIASFPSSSRSDRVARSPGERTSRSTGSRRPRPSRVPPKRWRGSPPSSRAFRPRAPTSSRGPSRTER